jgi:hypothetical protein
MVVGNAVKLGYAVDQLQPSAAIAGEVSIVNQAVAVKAAIDALDACGDRGRSLRNFGRVVAG